MLDVAYRKKLWFNKNSDLQADCFEHNSDGRQKLWRDRFVVGVASKHAEKDQHI
jgi:hypothetical protein